MPKRAAPLFLLALLLAPRADAANVVVRFTTVLGDFDVELCTETSDACPGVAPNTVANFLHYVDDDVYTETMFIHRRGPGGASPSPAVLQGGGYWWDGSGEVAVVRQVCPPAAPVPCESIPLELDPNLSNLRGTIAMARSTLPDTATSQWFINLVDNVNLDTAGGGYAVFGKVVSGLDVVDAIGALTVYNFGSPFNELPMRAGWPGGDASVEPFLVYVPDIARVPEPGGVATACAALVVLAKLARRRGA
jgi:peptidyl-prolyl cis-trans isomerase A (cyclophilin A)